MILPRSQSTNFDNGKESKSKKFWKSLTSKDKTSSMPKSFSTARISTVVAEPIKYKPEPIKELKRSSMIIEPRVTSIRKNARKSRHLSAMDFSLNKIDQDVTDPKELEFYNQILKHDSSTIYETSYESELESMGVESQKSASEMLNLALEDYKLFINDDSDLESPVESNFEEQLPTSFVSLPSFESCSSLESEVSIFEISNSLWIGSKIYYDENEEIYDRKFDAFGDVDVREVFNERNDNRNYLHRTSLFFG